MGDDGHLSVKGRACLGFFQSELTYVSQGRELETLFCLEEAGEKADEDRKRDPHEPSIRQNRVRAGSPFELGEIDTIGCGTDASISGMNGRWTD